jgi:hypothetical protein
MRNNLAAWRSYAKKLNNRNGNIRRYGAQKAQIMDQMKQARQCFKVKNFAKSIQIRTENTNTFVHFKGIRTPGWTSDNM